MRGDGVISRQSQRFHSTWKILPGQALVNFLRGMGSRSTVHGYLVRVALDCILLVILIYCYCFAISLPHIPHASHLSVENDAHPRPVSVVQGKHVALQVSPSSSSSISIVHSLCGLEYEWEIGRGNGTPWDNPRYLYQVQVHVWVFGAGGRSAFWNLRVPVRVCCCNVYFLYI